MKKFDKIFFFSILLLVIVVHFYAYRVWLFAPGVLTQGDWILSLPNWSQSLLSLPTIWKSYAIGSLDFTPPFYIFMLLEGFLSHLGISYAYIERMTFLWPIALFTLPLSFLFVRSFVKNSFASFLGAIVYTYNTYFLIIQTGHLTLMIGFALAPLAFLFFKKSIEMKSYFYALLTGLVGFIISFFEFRAFYMLCLIFASYYLYYIIYISPEKAKTVAKKTFLITLTPLAVVFALSIYWIYPFVSTPPMAFGSVFNRDLFGKEFFNISRAFTLFHPYWTGGKYFPFIGQPTPFYFFLVPMLVFIGAYVNRKNKYILFFTCLSLLGIFLTKQDNAPFAFIYPLLYKFFPGFGAFREASKFYFFIALGYSVVIASFFAWSWVQWKNGFLKYLKYALVVLVVFLSLFNTKPLVTSEFGSLFVTREMPSEYLKFNNYIDGKKEFFRTLWVPVDARWGTNTNLHPRVGIANVLTATWKPFSDVGSYPSLGDQFIDFFNKPNAQELLNTTAIRYIIIPLEDTANDDDFFLQFYKNKADYEKKLDTTPYLTKVDIGLKEIKVYENKSVRPHIYTTFEKESLSKNVTFSKVNFSSIDTTRYEIELKNIKKPIYLHFADQYHPSWKLHLGSFDWYKALVDKNYFLPDTIHFKNEANLNTFRIDPSEIIAQSDKSMYRKNNDGSIDMHVTLYFAPQSKMYIGSIISIIAFILIIFGLIFTGFKKR